MKFKVGDVVKIDKDKVALLSSILYGENVPCPLVWYSTDIYTIKHINDGVAELNKNLNNSNNKININYLKLLKEERKNKLSEIIKLL